jgi:hypothetical protein
VAVFALTLSGCGGEERSAALALDEAGSGFAIQMHRDAEVGDRYRLHERWRLERVVTVRRGEDVVERDEMRRAAALDADVLVVAVTEDGKELERRLTVRRFRYVWNGVPGAPIPEGSVIRVIAAQDGRGVIEWDGDAELPADASAALRAVVSTIVRPGTDDDMFGTASRQEIGARWSVDGARAAADLSAVPGLTVAPDGVRGESVLVEATQVDGIDCLAIETELTASLSEMPPPRDGAVVEEALVDVLLEGQYPVQRSLPQLETSRRTHLVARGRIAAETEGAETFEMEATTSARRRVIPEPR